MDLDAIKKNIGANANYRESSNPIYPYMLHIGIYYLGYI